jgi:FMN phosphatase YigB (HAD superfamily)
MPFVHRDANGKILAVYTEPVEGAVEVEPNDPALKAFIQQNIPPDEAGAPEDWMQSDLGLVRVIEDLIEVLIDKKLIMFTDFPEGAQKKLLDRRGLRKEFDLVEGLFGDGEDIEGGDGEDSGLL